MAVDIHSLRVAQERGLTVGVVPTDGTLRIRLEIDEFIKDADVTNLYLLALIELQKPEVWKQRFSYFQMAGIHGKPYTPWDHVFPTDGSPDWDDLEKGPDGLPRHEPNPKAGYCSHGSNLFPTWHRAYLAMLEQVIFLKMVEIAEQFPETYRRRYRGAAHRFGLPYWDPFIARRRVINQFGYPIFKCGVPIILMILQVRVRKPEQPNILIEVDNPLYSYRFPPETANWDADPGFSWQEMFEDVLQKNQMPNMALGTIRGLSAAGTTDHKFLNNTLTNAVSQSYGPALPLGGKIYRILNGPPLSYTQMSNSAYVPPPSDAKERSFNEQNSVEGFHNDIHNMCGTGEGGKSGHMAWNEFAAFDPIFFLHHTNIDRICAIWQALNESTWWEAQPLLETASYVTALGTEERPTSPLVPFRKHIHQNGRPIWWTSNDLRHCRSLGYNYPEISKAGSDSGLLRQWAIDSYESTTISGNPPPLETSFKSEDLEGVEAFPNRLEIDGKWPPIEIPENRHGLLNNIFRQAAAASKTVGGCFVRGGRSPEHDAHKRYRHLKRLVKDKKMTQWNATIRVQKFALGGSFSIFMFLGEFSEDPRTWHHDSRLIGIDGIFATRSLDNCENCRNQSENGLIDSDVIPLTTPLVAYWKSQEAVCGLQLQSLEPDQVLPFLKRNLHWRLIDATGRQHDRRHVASLRVDIGSQIVRLPFEFGQKPVYEEEIIYQDLTNGY